MKKVGIITFHGAHNYGSVLQAYALQKKYRELGAVSEIIDFRTEKQKEQYRPLTKRKGFRYILKNIFFLLNYKNRKKKYDNFENFISTKLNLSCNSYDSLEQLEMYPPDYDLFICGSDQIWNTSPNDASMAYFLPFVKNTIKVSYAPSFGQLGEIKYKKEIAEYLRDFNMISVREERGAELVQEMIGIEPKVLVDPTLLFDAVKCWDEICAPRIVEGDYIFFYSLFSTKELISSVKEISKKTNLPVVISNVSNQNDIMNGFIKITYAGPCEFLSLIKNSKLVVTSSFHGTIFSVLYKKPLMVFKGMLDKRINTILQKLKLEQCSFMKESIDETLNSIFSLDYYKTDECLIEERNEAVKYLEMTLEL